MISAHRPPEHEWKMGRAASVSPPCWSAANSMASRPRPLPNSGRIWGSAKALVETAVARDSERDSEHLTVDDDKMYLHARDVTAGAGFRPEPPARPRIR
jgi:hypothetical protein